MKTPSTMMPQRMPWETAPESASSMWFSPTWSLWFAVYGPTPTGERDPADGDLRYPQSKADASKAVS